MDKFSASKVKAFWARQKKSEWSLIWWGWGVLGDRYWPSLYRWRLASIIWASLFFSHFRQTKKAFGISNWPTVQWTTNIKLKVSENKKKKKRGCFFCLNKDWPDGLTRICFPKVIACVQNLYKKNSNRIFIWKNCQKKVFETFSFTKVYPLYSSLSNKIEKTAYFFWNKNWVSRYGLVEFTHANRNIRKTKHVINCHD